MYAMDAAVRGAQPGGDILDLLARLGFRVTQPRVVSSLDGIVRASSEDGGSVATTSTYETAGVVGIGVAPSLSRPSWARCRGRRAGRSA